MKTWLIGALALAVLATGAPTDAQARRLSGGKSAGLQRNMPARTAPDAPPAKAPGAAATPAQGTAATPAAAAAPAAAPKRNWMGPLAGLAAGLGLAALMSHLGMGEGFANILMMALLAATAFFVIRLLMRRYAGGGVARGPALAGAGTGAGGAPAPFSPVQRVDPPALADMAMPRSALGSAAAIGGATTGDATPAEATVTRAFVPAAFDSEGFARTAKMIFIRLQAAHDTADLDDLKRFTTPELFASLRLDIQERGNIPQHTDVQEVEAEVLDIADEADRQIVSVRFHGRMVEDKGADATAFNEVWHLVKPHDDSRSWAIAGIEQMP